MMRETIIDKDLLRNIIWDDVEGYRLVEAFHVDKSRWHILTETIFRRESDNKLFITYWRQGATENQDHEYPEEAFEAEEYTETIVRYRAIPYKKCSMENFDND